MPTTLQLAPLPGFSDFPTALISDYCSPCTESWPLIEVHWGRTLFAVQRIFWLHWWLHCWPDKRGWPQQRPATIYKVKWGEIIYGFDVFLSFQKSEWPLPGRKWRWLRWFLCRSWLMDGRCYLVWMQLWSDEDQIAGRVMLQIKKKIRNQKSSLLNAAMNYEIKKTK